MKSDPKKEDGCIQEERSTNDSEDELQDEETDLTDFQKNKIKEWDEFSKQNPWSWKTELRNNWLYVICFITLLIGVITL